MKSQIAKISIVLLCLLLLTACGKKGPVRPVDSVASAEKPPANNCS
jgi:predicted small lipoprotein YifL